MKNYIVSAFILTLLVGCDAPVRTRDGIFNTNGNALNDGSGGGFTETPNKSDDTMTTSGSGSGDATVTGFANCDQTKTETAPTIGNTSICQHQSDETIVLVKTSVTDLTTRLCLIPTYKDEMGSSTYIGQPQCFYAKENVSTQGKLYKNRQGFFGNGVPFAQLPLKGVMVMKETSLTAYFNCMNAIGNFPRTQMCPNGAQTAPYYAGGQLINCPAMAQTQMNTYCSDFKVSHSYLDWRLKP